MRETNGTLLQTCKDYCIDPSTTSPTAITATSKFLQSEINKTVRYIFTRTRNYKTELDPTTMTTTADQIYYSYPRELDSISTITMEVGSIVYPLQCVQSQQMWDELQLIEFASDTIPKYFFPRSRDFGIYPTPQDAYTVTLVGNRMPRNMTVSDESTGTVTVTQNSQTVTGSSTSFTASMVGRYFSLADSGGVSNGNWYKVSARASATSITLETYFEESTASGQNYLIGESPELPVELHELIPYRVAATYFHTYRRDPSHAQKYMNFFFTGDFENPRRSGDHIEGGLIGAINRYRAYGRDDEQLVEMGKKRFIYGDRFWGTTLTDV